jgi:ABC-type Fe3+/spermidine/putrescine transport system ATPase subunit
MTFLQVSGISLRERGNDALHDISFTQPPFRKLAIAGETGAGKSTLLQVIAGLVRPDSGEVRFDGARVRGPGEVLVPGHPGIAYLSQQFELPTFLRVEQALRYANTLSAAAAAALYDVCRIGHLAPRRTDQLSGGERQRIALARLLLTAPRLLLLDEPFSNLDRGHKQELKAVIADLSEQLGITCILVSHDPLDTLSWADEILVLRAGQLVQQGPPRRVYAQPVDEYTAGLFGDYNLLTGPLAASFGQFTGRGKKGRRLLIRPEKLVLGPAEQSGLAGAVAAIRFFGSYSEVDVVLSGGRVTVRASAAEVAVGTAVGVSVPADGVWYL